MTLANVQYVSQLWKLRGLALEEKILIFKTLALSEIIFQIFYQYLTTNYNWTTENAEKRFYGGIPLQNLNIVNDYKDGGSKSIKYS